MEKVRLAEHLRHSHEPLMGFTGSYMGSLWVIELTVGGCQEIIYHRPNKEGSHGLSQLLHDW